jgi:hypothetical protein
MNRTLTSPQPSPVKRQIENETALTPSLSPGRGGKGVVSRSVFIAGGTHVSMGRGRRSIFPAQAQAQVLRREIKSIALNQQAGIEFTSSNPGNAGESTQQINH